MIERVGVVAKVRLLEAASSLAELATWLDSRGIEPVFEAETATLVPLGGARRRVSRDEMPNAVDLIVVLGGDGTLLGMADRIGQTGRDIPILGVNFGHLGFLTEMSMPELFPALEAAIVGAVPIDRRLMLRAIVRRDDVVIADRIVLNDVIVTRGALSRLLELSVWVSGQFMASFHGDGLIVASPTGSTAYNLSAGGPIVHPEVEALLITPIAPHTLTNRPLAIPASSEVSVQPHLTDPSQQVFATLDGQAGLELRSGDLIAVKRAPTQLQLVRASRTYYEVLREKLRWAER